MRFLPLIFVLWFSTCDVTANTLFLKYSIKEDKIVSQGSLNDTSIHNEVNLESVLRLTAITYDIIQKKKHRKKRIFTNNIAQLSQLFLQPYSQLINKCDEINIQIDSALVQVPFEYMIIGDRELGIYKPVIFSLQAQRENELYTAFTIDSGTIVRTKDCDPENACQTIKDKYPKLHFYTSDKLLPNQLSDREADLLLVSAHGYANAENHGHLGWNKTLMEADYLRQSNPKLTYFDSCQQGINLTYITALLETEGINYYIAPVISNDAGDSSTKTIEWFFENINTESTLSASFLKTKQRLMQFYKKKRLLTQYNKSLSFRIYCL